MSTSNVSLAMTIMSAISVIGSFTIILSFVMIKSLRMKQTYQVIFYYAISTFLTSLGSTVGLPNDRTSACWFEGIITNIFTISSVFWNVIINYIMYSVVKGHPFTISYDIHIFCWLFPIIVTLLPLINSRYGNDGGNWCFIIPDNTAPTWSSEFWTWFSFYIWIWLAVTIDIVLFIIIKRLIIDLPKDTSKLIKPVIRKLQWYPIVIVFSWGLATVTDTFVGYLGSSGNYPGSVTINNLSNIIPTTQGFLSTIVFWYTMDARKIWFNYIYNITSNKVTSSHLSRKSIVSVKKNSIAQVIVKESSKNSNPSLFSFKSNRSIVPVDNYDNNVIITNVERDTSHIIFRNLDT